ncbi:MAG: hypothetical protein K6A23_09430 [Butyrivibrio sp.]|nr:hypothetical protein [Butyrivibrio sp.]
MGRIRTDTNRRIILQEGAKKGEKERLSRIRTDDEREIILQKAGKFVVKE